MAKIEHVFVLMMENRSFDHMLAFSGLPGIAPPPGKFGFKSGAADPADRRSAARARGRCRANQWRRHGWLSRERRAGYDAGIGSIQSAGTDRTRQQKSLLRQLVFLDAGTDLAEPPVRPCGFLRRSRQQHGIAGYGASVHQA